MLMAIWSDGGVGIDGQCKAKVLKCRGTGVVTVEKEGSPITMPIPITITQCWQLKTPLESPFQPPEPPTSPYFPCNPIQQMHSIALSSVSDHEKTSALDRGKLERSISISMDDSGSMKE